VSHLKERTEKNCLNCNAEIIGKYCHICGQENIHPKETVWHLVNHFFQDITHFDGKFFSTVGLLIRKPGFLPAEYIAGRRASYLNPIRMYVFTSAVFFLIFFSFFPVNTKSFVNDLTIDGRTAAEIRKLPTDSFMAVTARINDGVPLNREQFEKHVDSLQDGFHLTGSRYKSKQEYDSILAKGIKKHNWLQRKLIYREIEANETYHNDSKQFFRTLLTAMIHNFPKMFFISLPLFALFLKALYWRHKEYFYVSHGMFSIYLYIFVFIILLFLMAVKGLIAALHWEWLEYLRGALLLYIFIYEYKALRNFYRQGRGKTILKFILLNTLSFVMIMILFIMFLLFSFMNV